MNSREILYEEIMVRGERNLQLYSRFLLGIKKKKLPLEKLFSEAHDIAFEEIDCLKCGRCCSGLGPRIREKDAARLAKREKLKLSAYVKQRLRTDEEGDMIFNNMPCPYFGSDGYCLVYEDRPEACRDYPHMDRGRQKARVAMHIENLLHCPAVILATEYLMEEIQAG